MKLSCILVALAAAQYDDLQNVNAASMSLSGAEWTFGTPNSAHWGTMAITKQTHATSKYTVSMEAKGSGHAMPGIAVKYFPSGTWTGSYIQYQWGNFWWGRSGTYICSNGKEASPHMGYGYNPQAWNKLKSVVNGQSFSIYLNGAKVRDVTMSGSKSNDYKNFYVGVFSHNGAGTQYVKNFLIDYEGKAKMCKKNDVMALENLKSNSFSQSGSSYTLGAPNTPHWGTVALTTQSLNVKDYTITSETKGAGHAMPGHTFKYLPGATFASSYLGQQWGNFYWSRGGTYVTSNGKEASPWVSKGFNPQQWNAIKTVVKGTSFSMYLNGAKVHSGTMSGTGASTYQNFKVGIFSHNGAGTQYVRNFKVSYTGPCNCGAVDKTLGGLQNINANSFSQSGSDYTFGAPSSAHWGTMAISKKTLSVSKYTITMESKGASHAMPGIAVKYFPNGQWSGSYIANQWGNFWWSRGGSYVTSNGKEASPYKSYGFNPQQWNKLKTVVDGKQFKIYINGAHFHTGTMSGSNSDNYKNFYVGVFSHNGAGTQYVRNFAVDYAGTGGAAKDELENLNGASFSASGTDYTFGTPSSAHWGTMALATTSMINVQKYTITATVKGSGHAMPGIAAKYFPNGQWSGSYIQYQWGNFWWGRSGSYVTTNGKEASPHRGYSYNPQAWNNLKTVVDGTSMAIYINDQHFYTGTMSGSKSNDYSDFKVGIFSHNGAGTQYVKNFKVDYAGKDACLSCKPGTFKDPKKGCVQCEAGKYARLTNSMLCLSCLPGRFGTKKGMKICDQCPAGKFGDHPYSKNTKAYTTCATCPAGKFSGALGMAFCAKCMLGTYAPNTGMTACRTCDAGLHRKVVQTAAQEKAALNGASPAALVAKVAVSPQQARQNLKDRMLNIFGKASNFGDMDPLYYLYRFSGEPTKEENMAVYPNCCYKNKMAMMATSTQVGEWANLVMHEGMELKADGFSNKIDTDFVRGMLPHHQGAVDMAKIQKCYGKENSLKKFNDWIIGHQNFEIDTMVAWQKKNDKTSKASDATLKRRKENPCATKGNMNMQQKMKSMMGMMMSMRKGCMVNGKDRCHVSVESNIEYLKNHADKAKIFGHIINSQMHCGMMIQFSGDADEDYVRGMIPHHKGAVDMCKVVLKYGKDEQMKIFCTDIIGHQATEIEWMKQWLSRNTPANGCARKCPVHHKLSGFSAASKGTCVACEYGTHDTTENTKQFCVNTPYPTPFPTPYPTPYPTPAPTGILQHQTCTRTTCTYTNGQTHIITDNYTGKMEPFHCEKVGRGCKCVCHKSLHCALRHHHTSGYKKTFEHC